MFDYLQQFNSLPKELKEKISSPEVMSLLSEIESRYRVDLAMVVMKIMIKSLAIKDLPSTFIGEFGLSSEQAEKMAKELKEKVFVKVADHVGIVSELRSIDLNNDVNALIKEAGLLMPSEFLVERLNRTLGIYLRGVRNRIDTKASLTKEIAIGGLNLSSDEAERVLKICDTRKFKFNEEIKIKVAVEAPIKRLDKIVLASDQSGMAALNKLTKPVVEYDLKKALASGETKRITAPVKEEIKITQPEEKKPVEEIKPAEVKIPESPKEPVEMPKESKEQKERKIAEIIDPNIVHKPQETSILKKIIPTFKVNTDLKSASVPVASSQILQSKIVEDTKSVNLGSVLNPVSSPAAVRKSILGNTPSSPSRPVMHDIKPTPKIMGPLEELQFLDLVNFRRLGKTPDEITGKIFTKIKLLEKDGYEKMIAGIGAWRKSPVSRLYLSMVQEAVIANLTLKESIDLREKKNKEGLTMKEIEAIMSLNSKLIF